MVRGPIVVMVKNGLLVRKTLTSSFASVIITTATIRLSHLNKKHTIFRLGALAE